MCCLLGCVFRVAGAMNACVLGFAVVHFEWQAQHFKHMLRCLVTKSLQEEYFVISAFCVVILS